MNPILETIEQLRSAPPGHAFCVLGEDLTDMHKVPVPDYPHIMVWDGQLSNLVIMRLADGDDMYKVLERGTLYAHKEL